jgi:PAS domain S-box-containing protein
MGSERESGGAPAQVALQRAQALERLTQTALAHLAQADLLPELLDRVREIMEADNAAVLLLDETEQYLTLHAVRGPEEIVKGEVRVPVGRGVAGTIVATGKPRLIDDLTTVEVANPFLREHLRSLVGAPLRVGGKSIGAIHVDSVRTGHFTEDDVAMLETVADRVALAIDHARLLQLAEQRRVEAETARREAEARTQQLETVFAAMADMIFVYDRDMRLVRTNAAGRAVVPQQGVERDGRPLPQRLAGEAVRDVEGHPLAPEDFPVSRVLRGEVITGTDAVDTMHRTTDGREVLFSTTGAPVRDEHGQTAGGVIIVRDVTERRRLERRTHRSLEALLEMAEILVAPHTMFELAGADDVDLEAGPRGIAHRLAVLARDVLGCERIGLWVAEPETGIMAPLTVVGLTREQEEQWWAEQWATPPVPLRENPDTTLVGRLEAGEPVVLDMTQPPYNEAPNSVGALSVVIAPMLVSGELLGLIALDHGRVQHHYTPEELDLAGAVAKLAGLVIQRDQLLREREAAQAHALALEESTRRMDEFLSVVSHELRTPVTVIKSTIQALLKRAERAERAQGREPAGTPPSSQTPGRDAEVLRRTDRQVNRLTRLLDDLVDMSRIHAGKLDLRPERADLAAIVRETVESERMAHPGRAIALYGADEGSVPLFADADRIGQVLTNYLTNALKYSAPEFPVVTRLSVADAGARVEVSDKGPGIPPEEQPRVWELFHRVPGIEVQSGSGVGLGLGLYISRTIIERHGGQVGVESEEGEGSTFYFTLPLQRSDAPTMGPRS